MFRTFGFPDLAPMLKIGLTGGIGSGKTTVANIFKVLDIPVFDADAAAKQLMEEDPFLRKGLLDLFGEASFVKGRLDRSYIAGIVFKDPYQLERLNALVHPAAIAAAEQWAEKQTAPYVVKEAALFFEAGSATGLDYMIGVYAPRHVRLNRVMKRDGSSREEVMNRMQRQIQEEIKMRLCDFVVINDDQQLLIPQVLKLHGCFLDEAKQAPGIL
ncbi:MAG: dephospho-CoA kinase [Sediminibacterium sp.]